MVTQNNIATGVRALIVAAVVSLIVVHTPVHADAKEDGFKETACAVCDQLVDMCNRNADRKPFLVKMVEKLGGCKPAKATCRDICR